LGESNRCFHTEGRTGILPPGETAYCDEGLRKILPVGYYDVGMGIYDEVTNVIMPTNAYDTTNQREATADEREWIRAKAARGQPR